MELRTAIPPQIRAGAIAALEGTGVDLNDYVRMAIMTLAQTGRMPFTPFETGVRRGRPTGYSPNRAAEQATQ